MSRSLPILACSMMFAPMIQFGTFLRLLKVVFSLGEPRVDEIFDIVVHEYGARILKTAGI